MTQVTDSKIETILEAYASGNYGNIVKAVLRSHIPPVSIYRTLMQPQYADKVVAANVMNAYEKALMLTINDRFIHAKTMMPIEVGGFEVVALDVEPDLDVITAEDYDQLGVRVLSPWGLLKKNIISHIEQADYDPTAQQVYGLYSFDFNGFKTHLMDFLHVEEAISTGLWLHSKFADPDSDWRDPSDEYDILFVDKTKVSDTIPFITNTGVMFGSQITQAWR